VVNLLEDLREKFGLTYLFIAQDLSVVRHLCQRVAVMYLGELFEVGFASDLFSPPLHPYTEALISAIPSPDPRLQTRRIHLSSEIPSPANKPSGVIRAALAFARLRIADRVAALRSRAHALTSCRTRREDGR